MDETLHILVVDPRGELAAAVMKAGGEAVVATVVSRPAHVVRTFDAEPPDAIIIAIGARPEQTELLVQALRERPLGALVPIVLCDVGLSEADHVLGTPSGAREAGADRFFAPGSPPGRVLAAVADLAGMSPSTLVEGDVHHTDDQETSVSVVSERPAEGSSSWPGPAERVLTTESTAAQAVSRGAEIHRQLGGLDAGRSRPTRVDAEAIRRKLRHVRHEDYFTILEVRKSTDQHAIERAFRRLAGLYDERQLPRDIADRYHAELAEIRSGLEDAFGVLGREPMRTRYLRAVLESDRASSL